MRHKPSSGGSSACASEMHMGQYLPDLSTAMSQAISIVEGLDFGPMLLKCYFCHFLNKKSFFLKTVSFVVFH
jgi:hypothetical protein